jgi:UDP-N-acetylglucosamine:LPS N-acetylglucosamine transferase
MLLRPSFDQSDVRFATTIAPRSQLGLTKLHVIPDCNRNRPLQAAWCAVSLASLILRHRPHVVVSTGALPGVIAIAIARRTGAKTIWVDSIANAEEFSMAGKHARKHADLWLSQWPEVAEAAGATYAGSVL